MLASELLDVAVQVLRADLVEGSGVRPLEHRPEGLDTVRVSHPLDVFSHRMADLPVPTKP